MVCDGDHCCCWTQVLLHHQQHWNCRRITSLRITAIFVIRYNIWERFDGLITLLGQHCSDMVRGSSGTDLVWDPPFQISLVNVWSVKACAVASPSLVLSWLQCCDRIWTGDDGMKMVLGIKWWVMTPILSSHDHLTVPFYCTDTAPPVPLTLALIGCNEPTKSLLVFETQYELWLLTWIG